MAQVVLTQKSQAYNLDMKKPIFQVVAFDKPKLPVSRIEKEGMTLIFKEPYTLSVEYDNEYNRIVHRNEKLNLVISGETLDEVVDKFFDSFCFIWDEYAKEIDNNLTAQAIEMKEYLLTLAKEV